MMNWISSEISNKDIITIQDHRLSKKKQYQQEVAGAKSAAVYAASLYSASVEDLETVGCFSSARKSSSSQERPYNQ